MKKMRTDDTDRRGGAWLLAVALAGGGGLLYRIAGAPRLPGALPNGRIVLNTLTGTSIPYAGLGAFCTTLAWIIWLWLVGTLAIQFLLAVAEQVTSGAHWVRSCRLVVDPLTLPAVRRLIHGTAVAVTVAQLAVRSVPSAAAAPSSPAVAVYADLRAATSQVRTAPPIQQVGTYQVVPGDTLWALAERYYGDGDAWPRIVAANVGRRMPDGAIFPRNPELQPGWVLNIPDAAPAPAAAAQVTYVVRQGDDLRIIAQRFYGDEMQWPRIFAANRGAHLADGRTLTKPDLIWSGMRLIIPAVAPLPASGQAAATLPVRHTAPVPKPAAPSHSPTLPPPPVAAPAARAPAAAPTPPPGPSAAPAATPAPQSARRMPVIAATAMPTSVPSRLAPVPTTTPPPLPLPLPALGLAGLAALGAGGTVLLARRQRREPGVPADRDAGIPIRDGYADPAHAPTFAHRLYGGGEPALLVAEQVQRCLADEGLSDAQIIAVREGRHTMTLTVGGRLATRQRLLDLGPTLAEQLWAQVRVRPTTDGDVSIQLSRLGQLRLVAPPSTDAVPPLPLVAVGVLPTREALHANWRAMGSVLIAGTHAGATGTVLTSVLTALTARCHPDLLRVWMAMPRGSLPAPLFALPHLVQQPVELYDAGALTRLLRDLETAGEHGVSKATDGQPAPERLLVLGELADVPESELLPLLERGGPCGIRVLAATTRPDDVSEAVLRALETQLVLSMPDEERSIRCGGTPDASLLDEGELLVRIKGRTPLRVRAFKLEGRHLERLVEQMHAAYGAGERAEVAIGLAETQAAAETVDPAGKDIGAVAADAGQSSWMTSPRLSSETSVGPIPCASVGGVSVMAVTAPPAESLDGTLGARPAVAPAADTSSAAPTLAAASAPLLSIRCFGPLQVCAGEREISCLNQHHAWELLAYLATHGGSVSRQEVFDVFWPDVEGAVVGNRLDALVFRLKKVLSAQIGDGARDLLSRERGKVALEEAVATSDVQRFDALYQRLPQVPVEQQVTELEAALTLAGDELLTGADYAWLEQPGEDGLTLRERYEERVAKLTHDLACRYRDSGKVDRAIVLFRSLLDAQPTLQPAARGLYRCFALAKDQEALALTHARLVEALRRERQVAGADLADSYALSPKTLAAYQQAKGDIQRTAHEHVA